MNHSTRSLGRALASGTALATLVIASFAAHAADAWPTRQITIVVPAPPGGGVDTVGRIIAQQLSSQLGVPVIIENRAGAGGVVGARHVKASKPDGYTLQLNANHQIVNPMIRSTAGYDAEQDFAAVTMIGRVPLAVFVAESSPYRTLGDLFAAARKRPEELNWANSSTGTAGHMATELLRNVGEVNMPIINYNGGAPALTAVMAEQVTAVVEPLTTVLPQLSSGKLRVIAVTSATRVSQLPNVPTVAESGYPGFEINSWYGLWAPKGTPLDVRQRLAGEVQAAVEVPAIKTRFQATSFEPVGSTPAEFETFLKQQTTLYQALVDKAHIRVE
ncbi:tripartite tricarboxylate transporter substrate binding protein [soil metagenome]